MPSDYAVADAVAVLIGAHLAVIAVVALLVYWVHLEERFALIRADLAQRGHSSADPRHRRDAHRPRDRAAAGSTGGAADPPTSGGTTSTPRDHTRAS